MPKLMVSAASDEFFMPDDYDYFFRDLLGEKYIWWGFIISSRNHFKFSKYIWNIVVATFCLKKIFYLSKHEIPGNMTFFELKIFP